jgi:hypothetical protein
MLTLWRCAKRAYIASERFLLPEADCLLFLVVRAREAQIVPDEALSRSSRPVSPATLKRRSGSTMLPVFEVKKEISS